MSAPKGVGTCRHLEVSARVGTFSGVDTFEVLTHVSTSQLPNNIHMSARVGTSKCRHRCRHLSTCRHVPAHRCRHPDCDIHSPIERHLQHHATTPTTALGTASITSGNHTNHSPWKAIDNHGTKMGRRLFV